MPVGCLRGHDLNQGLGGSAHPPLVLHMLKVGEGPGPDEMLSKIADFEDEVKCTVDRLGSSSGGDSLLAS